MSVPDKVYLYHLTSVENLPSIIDSGGLCSKNRLSREQTTYQNIAYTHIQDRRANRMVPCAAGGCLHDYVPFYFGPRAPMLYVINQGGVEEYDEGQEPLVHLVTRVQFIEERNLEFAFTDRHAVLTYANFYDETRALDQVAHKLMLKRYWHDTDRHPQRKERRQAEFLVHDFVPFDLIGAIGVINEQMKEETERCLDQLDQAPPVIVKQSWYY
ncbi:MAG: DUF4433 domain-containing protein [Candidatus Bipolaricaulia bacterium]